MGSNPTDPTPGPTTGPFRRGKQESRLHLSGGGPAVSARWAWGVWRRKGGLLRVPRGRVTHPPCHATRRLCSPASQSPFTHPKVAPTDNYPLGPVSGL
ncbi:hypothetical protein Skr01_17670 [Sphaerisporangium krabiense]|nr:hypothetical protein Skr01_17670 [Sphaerisporangium krabiense]